MYCFWMYSFAFLATTWLSLLLCLSEYPFSGHCFCSDPIPASSRAGVTHPLVARLPSPAVAKSTVPPARYWTEKKNSCMWHPGQQSWVASCPTVLSACHVCDKWVSVVSCSENIRGVCVSCHTKPENFHIGLHQRHLVYHQRHLYCHEMSTNPLTFVSGCCFP